MRFFRKKPDPVYVTVKFRSGGSASIEVDRSTYNGLPALILEDCQDLLGVEDPDGNFWQLDWEDARWYALTPTDARS